MICDELADTGGSPFGLIMMVALTCLVTGVMLVLALRRRSPGINYAMVLVFVIGLGALMLPAPPAVATTPGCSTENAGIRVIQTSTMEGLAPNIAPAPITGEVMNTGTASIHITTVDVEITSITTQQHSPEGQCDPSDYTLLDRQMPVNRTLGIGKSTTFSGASIGFSNKPTIQDACKNATVHLRYTAHTSAP